MEMSGVRAIAVQARHPFRTSSRRAIYAKLQRVAARRMESEHGPRFLPLSTRGTSLCKLILTTGERRVVGCQCFDMSSVDLTQAVVESTNM